MNIKPQKGMQEYLPEAAAQRDRLMNLILETYTASGFTRIYTPAIESAENLDKSDGGDNLNLIFRIMKRGDKLAEALAKNPVDEKELCDLGLRYDLTLPLSRYYANNRNSLPSPRSASSRLSETRSRSVRLNRSNTRTIKRAPSVS